MNRNLLLLPIIGLALFLLPMLISDKTQPDSNPTPEEETVPEGPCPFCDGQGFIGDGRIGEDCRYCDSNGDGDNADPLPDGILPSPTSVEDDLGETPEETTPLPRFWFEDKQECFGIAERLGKNVVMLISPGTKSAPECQGCETLAENLADTSRIEGSGASNYIGWKVYLDDTDENLPNFKSFPYVGLWSPGPVVDDNGRREPELLWEGAIAPNLEINKVHQLLETFSPTPEAP